MVEGARLESVCAQQWVPGVRIPLSPPGEACSPLQGGGYFFAEFIPIFSHFILASSAIIAPMTPYIQALRAITFTTFRKLFIPAVWIVASFIALLLVATILLAIYFSPWWLLLLVLVVPLALVATIVGLLLWAIAARMRPRQLTGEESAKINDFTGKITRIAETRATPVPIIVFLIAKDVARGQKSRYVENLINDSTSLKSDFAEIAAMFRPTDRREVTSSRLL